MGDSASAVADSDKYKVLLDRIVMAEVEDWLNPVLEQVIDMACMKGFSKHRRMTYNPKAKVMAVEALEKLKTEHPKATKKELQGKVRSAVGDKKLRVQNVERWGVAKVIKKRGRKVNEAFEQAVLDQLVFTTLEKVDNVEKAVVIANVCYSHDIIRRAVEMTLQQPSFKDDAKLQKMKYTRPWIK